MARQSGSSKKAAWGGFDLSTTGLALGVRSQTGEEAYAATRMRGGTKWKSQPAFDLSLVPSMILSLLQKLGREGWTLNEMAFSFSVRQHDMVVLDKAGAVLIPALSWQCNAASAEVERLRSLGAEQTVGRIEERFILPKLMWALGQEPSLRKNTSKVMTTGDWIAFVLTGKDRLSTSDALSNGLLVQKNKRLASDVMQQAKLHADWFPKVQQSGRAVGRVTSKETPGANVSWAKVKDALAGAQVVAGLGDNHATGVGCGLDEDDFSTVVVSAGTSGTINRVCPPGLTLAGNAACFEFYKNRMLLMMLADCCKWYDRFVARYAADYVDDLDGLNELILHANPKNLRRIFHDNGEEIYPPDWQDYTIGEQAASTQYSIMLELLTLVQSMLAEVPGDADTVTNFVLTGGLSQSPFFQQAFHAGAKLLRPKARVLIIARKGPLRYQTAAYGALLNAMRPEDSHASAKLCPSKSSARPDTSMNAHLQYLMKSHGL